MNVEKNHSLDGIFIPQSLANANKPYIIKLLSESPKDVPLILFSEHPEQGIADFFEDFDFVEAAGGIVKRKEKYLVIKRNGIWDLPKGKLDPGESPSEAAIREIHEECGVLCEKVNQLITVTYHTYQYEGRDTIKKTYWYAMDFVGDKKLTPQKEEGISKVKWASRDKLIAIKDETFPSIYDVIDFFLA